MIIELTKKAVRVVGNIATHYGYKPSTEGELPALEEAIVSIALQRLFEEIHDDEAASEEIQSLIEEFDYTEK